MEFIIIISVIIILCIAYNIDKYNKDKKIATKEANGSNIICFIDTKHIIGLPLAEQSLCKAFLCNDKIIIKSTKTGSVYNLSMSKILDINIKSEEEIQTNYSSSIGGAIGGAVLFGPLGAIIGGRTKKKVDKICHSYLIFTYNNEKENKTDYISFDVTNNFKAYKFVDYFSKNCKNNMVTDL